KPEIVDLITTVGQTSSGFGATQATSYQSEISVSLNDKSLREDNTLIYAAKIKRESQNEFVNARIATIPDGRMGAEQAPLQLIVVGADLPSAMEFARKAEAELLKIAGTSEVELSVEDGNPEITVQVDRDKMSSLGLDLSTVGMTMQ